MTTTTFQVQGYSRRGDLIFTATRKTEAAAEKLAASKRTPFATKHGSRFVVSEVTA